MRLLIFNLINNLQVDFFGYLIYFYIFFARFGKNYVILYIRGIVLKYFEIVGLQKFNVTSVSSGEFRKI